MRKFAVLILILCAAAAGSAHATVVYQTVQPTSPDPIDDEYHTFFTQITGSGRLNFGDEIRLGSGTTDRYLTSAVVPTATTQGGGIPEYTPAFIELRLWPNDGPPSADGTAPDGNPTPGALPFAVARVPGPTYPAGGNHGSNTNFQGIPVAFNFQPTSMYNATNSPGGDAVFVNNLNLPERFTVTICNVNAQGVQDGNNPDGNAFSIYLSGASTSNVDPDGNPLTDNNDTAYNTNVVGTSRTGPVISFANPGHWIWNQQNGSPPGTGWTDARLQNLALSMTINAVPEPGTAGLIGAALVGSLARRRPRRR